MRTCRQCEQPAETGSKFCSVKCRNDAYKWHAYNEALSARREPGARPLQTPILSQQIVLDQYEIEMNEWEQHLEATEEAEFLALKELCNAQGNEKSVWSYVDDAHDFWPRPTFINTWE